MVALVLETVRRPEEFLAALAKANERNVPVLALKVGRTEGAKEMVVAHSGALAGEHGAYEAVFDAFDVHECRDLEELADSIELFSSPRRVVSGAGIGRAGTMAAAVLMTMDVPADDALAIVAEHRPMAGPEAGAQRDLIDALAARYATP